MKPRDPTRVLIVDDSASVRQTLVTILEGAPDIRVIGTAADPFIAARRIQEEVPDVILLDLEMPRMDGLTFLRKIMAQRPIPVIVCSALTEAGSQTLFDVLEAGAVDVVPKPRIDTRQFLVNPRCGSATRSGPPPGRNCARPPEAAPHREEADGRCRAARPDPQSGGGRDGPDRLHRRLDGGHGIAARRARSAAAGLPRPRDRPAHARAFHRGLRPAARQPLRRRGEGGGGRGCGAARPGPHRPRGPASAAAADRESLQRVGEGRPLGLAAPAVRGRAVPRGRALRRRECARHPDDRHGR